MMVEEQIWTARRPCFAGSCSPGIAADSAVRGHAEMIKARNRTRGARKSGMVLSGGGARGAFQVGCTSD